MGREKPRKSLKRTKEQAIIEEASRIIISEKKRSHGSFLILIAKIAKTIPKKNARRIEAKSGIWEIKSPEKIMFARMKVERVSGKAESKGDGEKSTAESATSAQ